MDKRFQVFISSTFRDLLDERQAVLKAVLELGHMPAGMELFPAGDEESWELIKDVIDGSDYYVLIVGGRYGSLDRNGLGYTEKEYDYAIAKKIPVIPLLHKSPDNLPRDRTDTDPEAWTRLTTFRKRAEAKHTCSYWTSAEELKARVIVALTSAVKRHPTVGWIRADQVPSDATVAEVLKLRERISSLEAKLEERRTRPPEGAQQLAQGEDSFAFKYMFQLRQLNKRSGLYNDTPYRHAISLSWNDTFAAIAPRLMNETPEYTLRHSLENFIITKAKECLSAIDKFKLESLKEFTVSKTQIDTCIVQFRALGLIAVSEKQRSVKDTYTYWTLTPYGDYLMTQLRALRRSSQMVDFDPIVTGPAK